MTTATCEQFEDAAEDLALGYASEPRRAELLAHAASCARCGRLLRDLSMTVDRVLELSPEAEPPVGFETRALQAMGVGRALPRRPSRARIVAVAAVFLLVGMLAGVGLARLGNNARDPGADVAAPVVSKNGKALGVVEV